MKYILLIKIALTLFYIYPTGLVIYHVYKFYKSDYTLFEDYLNEGVSKLTRKIILFWILFCCIVAVSCLIIILKMYL